MPSFLKDHIEFSVLTATILLVAIGLLSIYSATYDAGMADVSAKQIYWAISSLLVMVVVALVPYRLLTLAAYPAYFVSILMLVAVLLLGKTVSGSTSWFNLGPFRLQPSEFTKLTTILVVAAYLSRSDVSLRTTKGLLITIGFVLLPVLLILKQPDTGTAIIYIGMLFSLLYWGGASSFTLLAITAPVVVAVAALISTTWFLIAVIVLGLLIYLTKEHRIMAAVIFSVMVLVGISVQSIYTGLKPYQQKRIASFLDPAADPLGAGYNVMQSKVAIGSGGLAGKGFLQGTQTQLNFIPEQWTDFIFCVPSEEFGFLGALTVLVLFLVLLLRGVKIASSVKNPFGSFVALGITAALATHVTINVGMAVGLLPVIGVPLPFLSYGGSALFTNMIMVGLLLNIYAHRKEH